MANSMIKLGIFYLTVAFLASNVASASRLGGDSAGGGNAIRCDDGKLYSWDLINASMASMPIDPELQSAKSARAILAIIAERLASVNPSLAVSLNDFLTLNENALDSSTRRLWLKQVNPLIRLGDEYRRKIPKTCVANATEDFQLLQAVIRSTPGESGENGKIIYNYDAGVLEKMDENSHVQLSFLYIHEWLRDYTKNPESLLLADQLLHSAHWPKAREFNSFLHSIGLQVPDAPKIATGTYTFKAGQPWLGSSFSVKYNSITGKSEIQGQLANSIEGTSTNLLKEILRLTDPRFSLAPSERLLPMLTISSDGDSIHFKSSGNLSQKLGRKTRKINYYFQISPIENSNCVDLNIDYFENAVGIVMATDHVLYCLKE